MKNLDYLTSYTHKGQSYTLSKVARFDSLGLWHCGDIGFSKHGTLFETVTHLVNNSEMGMTSSELHIESKTVVKHALLDLVEKNKLSRVKYYSTFDPFEEAIKSFLENMTITHAKEFDTSIPNVHKGTA